MIKALQVYTCVSYCLLALSIMIHLYIHVYIIPFTRGVQLGICYSKGNLEDCFVITPPPPTHTHTHTGEGWL